MSPDIKHKSGEFKDGRRRSADGTRAKAAQHLRPGQALAVRTLALITARAWRKGAFVR
jgi:hypothetical protein